MTTCFCGCGRGIKGIRLSAANKVAGRIQTDLALFRGGIADRLIPPTEVAAVAAMVDEGAELTEEEMMPLARFGRTTRPGADPHDAVALAQRVQDLGRLLGEADDAARGGAAQAQRVQVGCAHAKRTLYTGGRLVETVAHVTPPSSLT